MFKSFSRKSVGKGKTGSSSKDVSATTKVEEFVVENPAVATPREEESQAAAATTTPTTKARSGPGYKSIPGTAVLVTGSSGLCGARLVEMLLERGAKTVIAFDLAPPTTSVAERFSIAEKRSTCGGKIRVLSGKDGDLTSDDAVRAAFHGSPIDCVYHIGALVGPFFDREKYYGVNYYGTLRIIENCKTFKVPKLVYSSSPSTRFTGADVENKREDELPYPETWLAMYAEAKAKGEMAVAEACSPELRTISVAPHQIYGPYDTLFLPNFLETAGNGRLRIFGNGRSIVSVCYVDNYAHGLLCGADVLDDLNSPALGKFYIVTDGEPQNLWAMLNTAVVAMGFTDLNTKLHLPVWLLYAVAYVANFVGWITGKKFKLNPFNVRMLTIHRYFSLENSKQDLGYEPVVPFGEAWPSTIEWFKENWLPGFLEQKKNNDRGRVSKEKNL